jgi:DNA-directed RNA polymerase subunit RPC12/RpoP
MPLYNYRCSACGRLDEDKYVPSNEAEWVTDCPYCHASAYEMELRPPAVEDWGNGGAGRFFEHLAPEGMTFHSKSEYKRHLKQAGLMEFSPKTGMPGCGV